MKCEPPFLTEAGQPGGASAVGSCSDFRDAVGNSEMGKAVTTAGMLHKDLGPFLHNTTTTTSASSEAATLMTFGPLKVRAPWD